MISNPFAFARGTKPIPKPPPVAESDTESDTKFTLKEVARHTSSDDLWMIVHDQVYNVTQFIEDHPGGAEVLFDCAGIDATLAFDDVRHSDDAIQMLSQCRLGELTDTDKEFLTKINNITNSQNHKTSGLPNNSSSSSSSNRASNYNKRSKTKTKSKLKIPKKPPPPPRSLYGSTSFNNVVDQFSIPVLMFISCSALILYIYLQSVRWDH